MYNINATIATYYVLYPKGTSFSIIAGIFSFSIIDDNISRFTSSNRDENAFTTKCKKKKKYFVYSFHLFKIQITLTPTNNILQLFNYSVGFLDYPLN